MMTIKATAANRKVLRDHAREAIADYSPVMTWLLDQDGDLLIIEEPQGQTYYVGDLPIVATTGSFGKAHGDGATRDEYGRPYRTQRAYLQDLLGPDHYERIFRGRYTLQNS